MAREALGCLNIPIKVTAHAVADMRVYPLDFTVQRWPDATRIPQLGEVTIQEAESMVPKFGFPELVFIGTVVRVGHEGHPDPAPQGDRKPDGRNL